MKNLLKKIFSSSGDRKKEEVLDSTEEYTIFKEVWSSKKNQELREEGIQTAKALIKGQVVVNGDNSTTLQGTALAAYLKAVRGEKVHIISINEAVANKRFEELGVVLKGLDLSVGHLYHHQSPEDRRKAYREDVVFGTSGAFINDYLKDQKVLDPTERRQPTRSFAVVEQGDMVLLDQATRPVGIFDKDEKIIDSITLRSYFSNYKDLSALVDFDGGDSQEFLDLYGMSTEKVQGDKKLKDREKNKSYRIYKTLEEKRHAILEELKNRYRSAEPMLVSLRSDEKGELLMEHLEWESIPYRSLLIKDQKDEKTFVEDALNNQEIMLVVNPVSRGIEEFLPDDLHIICTERYMLRRNDEHLERMALHSVRNGSIEFILSLGDDLLDVFSEDEMEQFKDSITVEKDQPIDNDKVPEMMDYVQKRMKEKNASLRSYVQNFEAVVQKQREVIYTERDKVLMEEDIKQHVLNMMESVIDDEINQYTATSMFPEEWDLEGLAKALRTSFLPEEQLVFQDIENLTKKGLKAHLIQKASKAYMERKKTLGKESFDWMQRVLLLKTIDQKWAEHLEAMEELRQDMNLRAMGRQDPVRAFQVEGFEIFKNMTDSIPKELMQRLFSLEEEKQ